jgi:4-amino-4-deoxy-L-arabinose transferase-like glycosyltransferase
MHNKKHAPAKIALGVAALLFILILQYAVSIHRQSITWDESCHIYAGYSYWTRADYGMNPEHPPLVKLLATAPLLSLPLSSPPLRGGDFKVEAFLLGYDFIYGNGVPAETILWRVRLAASLITLLLALLIFCAAREMFSTGAAFLALTLFVFDPNILAHAAYVTTDMALTCLLFATVYAFYRYTKHPTWPRLALVGLAAGLALAAKHSAILLFPILLLLGAAEMIRRHYQQPVPSTEAEATSRLALRYLGALVVTGLISVVILWAFYGFQYAARPGGLALNPQLADYVQGIHHPLEVRAISAAARFQLLPESYLYGLTDVRQMADFMSTSVLGRVYPHGQWFYFPVAFVIKTPLVLMLLLLAALFLLPRHAAKRELLFLTIPPAFYFAVAMATNLNIGLRHILPIYPYLFILAGAAAWSLIARDRRWTYAIAALLLFTIASSLQSRHSYIAYSNELWGGPAHTYQYLTDSNADWGQQLISVKRYLDQNKIQQCWFAYFASVIDPAAYGIPCKPLTTIGSLWLRPEIDVPASVDGTVLISAGVLSGFELGPGRLNPYDQFQHLQPVAVIDYGVFAYQGHFDLSLASALNHLTRASIFEDRYQPEAALAELQTAAALAPDSARVQSALGHFLLKTKRPDEARQAFQKALTNAQTIEPNFQAGRVPGLQRTLASLSQTSGN